MSFLLPKAPKPVPSAPSATPAQQADAVPEPTSSTAGTPGSLISTSAQGLTRKARTVKPSLVGASIAN